MLTPRPPIKGYIVHKYIRRPAERDMTVCAGFLCTDGLIIGADTEFSGGVKWHAPKVRRESFAVGEYVLTGTGNSSFLGMAADIIKCALYGKREEFKHAANTDEQVCIFQSAIHKIIRKLYKEHLRFPAYDGQPIFLDLIIGAHFRGEGEDEQIKLMHCAGDGGACWIDHHIARGNGGDIAMRFLTMLSPGPCPMAIMSAVAFFCLAEAKLGAEGVGGESHLMRLPKPLIRNFVSDAPLIELAESALRLAVVECRDKSLSKERFDERVKDVFDKILAVKHTTDQQIEMEQFTLEWIRRLQPPR